MKKFYSTLAAIAAAATITVGAAIPELAPRNQQTTPRGLNPTFYAPSQKAVNQLANLATVDSYQGPVRAKQLASAEDVAGDYVMLSTSIFNNNMEGIGSAELTLSTTSDATATYVVFEQFLSFRTFSNQNASAECPNGGIIGVLNGNTITVPVGQVVGTYTPAGGTAAECFVVSYDGLDAEGNLVNLATEGEVVFTIDTNGNISSGSKGIGIYINNLGWWTSAENIKIVTPNGTVSSHVEGEEQPYTINVFTEKGLNDEGYETLFVSAMMDGDSYGVTFETEGNAAMATEQVVSDSPYITNGDAFEGFGDWILCAAAYGEGGGVSMSQTVTATIAEDGKSMTFDTTWSEISLNETQGRLYWTGLCSPAVITFGADDAGVNDIVVDNSNAPVEYFNLQGIRVANPEAGQLLIRRQGSEVSKILVK